MDDVMFLDKLLNDTFTEITEYFLHDSAEFNKNKLSDFAEISWYADCVREHREKTFNRLYNVCAKKKGYHTSE